MAVNLKPYPSEPTTTYILCPPYAVTGGPEALHQLGAALMELGHRVFMVYVSGNSSEIRFSASAMENRVAILPEWENPTPDYYKSYKVPFASSIVDNDRSLIVFPEIYAHLMKEFIGARKAYWWLSLDYGLQTIGECGGLEYLKSTGCMMLCQSVYAQRYIQENGFAESYLISDYTRVISQVSLPDGREDVVLYNRKGADVIEIIAPQLPDVEFRLLANMTGEQVHKEMSSAKLFMDFGLHPGMDRMPREAAKLGCCVITNRRGAAAYFEDVPLPELYKFTDPIGSVGEVGKTIRGIFADFDSHSSSLAKYRRRISTEREVFLNSASTIFGSYLS